MKIFWENLRSEDSKPQSQTVQLGWTILENNSKLKLSKIWSLTILFYILFWNIMKESRGLLEAESVGFKIQEIEY